jgi:ABC-type polar amino acid transport system ATPase subunit
MFFIVNKLKFLYFSIDIDEPTASLDPISVGKKNNNIFIIEAEMIIYSILRQKIGFLINFI